MSCPGGHPEDNTGPLLSFARSLSLSAPPTRLPSNLHLPLSLPADGALHRVHVEGNTGAPGIAPQGWFSGPPVLTLVSVPPCHRRESAPLSVVAGESMVLGSPSSDESPGAEGPGPLPNASWGN